MFLTSLDIYILNGVAPLSKCCVILSMISKAASSVEYSFINPH